jgi:hypothetical protein
MDTFEAILGVSVPKKVRARIATLPELYLKFKHIVREFRSGVYSKEQAKKDAEVLVEQAEKRLMTSSRRVLTADALIGDILAVGRNGFIYHAVRNNVACCAKSGSAKSIQQEFDMLQLGSCATALPAMCEPVPVDAGRSLLITPHYAMSVEEAAIAGRGNLTDSFIANVCLCCLASLSVLADQGLCHTDIKPGNLLMPTPVANQVPLVVLSDYEGVTQVGSPMEVTTSKYSTIGNPYKASHAYDLGCLVKTMLHLMSGQLDEGQIPVLLKQHYKKWPVSVSLCNLMIKTAAGQHVPLRKALDITKGIGGVFSEAQLYGKP